ncbi:uncharacterized protein LOC143252020 isoform X3 [Tachypleus tridentatus]
MVTACESENSKDPKTPEDILTFTSVLPKDDDALLANAFNTREIIKTSQVFGTTPTKIFLVYIITVTK